MIFPKRVALNENGATADFMPFECFEIGVFLFLTSRLKNQWKLETTGFFYYADKEFINKNKTRSKMKSFWSLIYKLAYHFSKKGYR